MPQTKVFLLSETAYQPGTDYDIVMLYQVLLGRNPENSAVIQNHKINPLNMTLQTFLTSPEFRDSVLTPLAGGTAVIRHDHTAAPSPDQLAWLFGRSLLDEGQKDILRQSSSWELFFQYLCSLDGFLEPLPPPPRRPVAAAVPFKPTARLLARQPGPATEPAVAPATPPGPTNAALMQKLEAIQAMLAQLLAASPAQASPAPASQAPPALPVQATAAAPPGKPSSKRAAR